MLKDLNWESQNGDSGGEGGRYRRADRQVMKTSAARQVMRNAAC